MITLRYICYCRSLIPADATRTPGIREELFRTGRRKQFPDHLIKCPHTENHAPGTEWNWASLAEARARKYMKLVEERRANQKKLDGGESK